MTTTPTVTLPAGTYLIGDPCYAIAPAEWRDFLTETWSDHDAFAWRGHPVAVYRTYGDGNYCDQRRRDYPVDSGLIAAIPEPVVAVRNYRPYTTIDFGQLVDFPNDFDCHADRHHITFGHVTIKIG